MSRMTLVISLIATGLAALAMVYGTRMADELRDSNSRLARLTMSEWPSVIGSKVPG